MAYDDALAQRVRDRMRDEPGVSEKKMFGGLGFLTAGNMTVGVHGDDLISRIDPESMDDALAEPGVRPFDMTGRPMRGWILVAGEGLADGDLDRWIGEALRYVQTLPPK
ncbi:MAG TPA: TfoX/Sxy family protein [Streptosporangiaceae bacterium]|nr:TfoX/Sxy family protein [Streptosporangiaceae bacterium]